MVGKQTGKKAEEIWDSSFTLSIEKSFRPNRSLNGVTLQLALRVVVLAKLLVVV